MAHESSINLAELASEKLIGMSKETFPGQNDRIRDVCRYAGFMPNLHLEADSHASILHQIVEAEEGNRHLGDGIKDNAAQQLRKIIAEVLSI